MDSCLICLEDCTQYLQLSFCDCKNIIHENCFKKYVKNSQQVRCLICKNMKEFSPKKCDPLDSIFYTMFFMLQNVYFYIDEKYFSNSNTFIRIFSVLLFHIFLTFILVMPWVIITYIKYSIHKSMLCKKPYKIYDL